MFVLTKSLTLISLLQSPSIKVLFNSIIKSLRLNYLGCKVTHKIPHFTAFMPFFIQNLIWVKTLIHALHIISPFFVNIASYKKNLKIVFTTKKSSPRGLLCGICLNLFLFECTPIVEITLAFHLGFNIIGQC